MLQCSGNHPLSLPEGRLHGTATRTCHLIRVILIGRPPSIPLLLEFSLLRPRQMGWEGVDPYKYNPERGLYYHEVWPSLFCGTQPRSMEDVDSLAELLGPKGFILNLQQDKDMEHWGVSLHDIQSQVRITHTSGPPAHSGQACATCCTGPSSQILTWWSSKQ